MFETPKNDPLTLFFATLRFSRKEPKILVTKRTVTGRPLYIDQQHIIFKDNHLYICNYNDSLFHSSTNINYKLSKLSISLNNNFNLINNDNNLFILNNNKLYTLIFLFIVHSLCIMNICDT